MFLVSEKSTLGNGMWHDSACASQIDVIRNRFRKPAISGKITRGERRRSLGSGYIRVCGESLDKAERDYLKLN